MLDPVSRAQVKALVSGAAGAPQTAAPVIGSYQVTQTTSNGTDTGANTQIAYTLPTGLTLQAVRLRFANHQCGSNGDLDNANAITVRASVAAAAAGPWFSLSVNGSKTISIDAGLNIDTDPLPLKISGTLYVKTFVSVTSGQVWPSHNISVTNGSPTSYTSSGSTTETDLTTSATQVTGSYARPFPPVAVLADFIPATTARLAIVGDSIAGGIGDSTASSDVGFILRAIGGSAPTVCSARVAASGAKLKDFIDPNVGRRRMGLTRGCNVAIDGFGTNDIFASLRTLAQLQADKLALWGILGARGMKTWATTLTPQTTSTDSWATTVNQATKTGETVRTGLNDWIRDGAPVSSSGVAVAVGTGAAGTLRAGAVGHPLSGWFEVADTVETARSSGLWKVDGTANKYTADGTHPTTFGHSAMAVAVTPATFIAAAA